MNSGGGSGKIFKIGVTVAIFVVVLVLINLVFSLAMRLLPLALLLLAAYFGWRWLKNNANNSLSDLLSRYRESKEDKSEAIRNQRYDEVLSQSSSAQDATFVTVTPDVEPQRAAPSPASDDMIEPDLDRLADKENEAPQITDDVLSQIEERRRRLGLD